MVHSKLQTFIKKNSVEVVIIVFALVFSFWLMFSTFSYKDGTMYIATKAWSDFGSHIPLIRSFSFGDNIPPQYPLFPGEPIRYHFLFYAFVGFLERLGLRIDYALNIPSALSFAALLGTMYFFGKTLFRNRAVGILAVVFFIFNGSLSFLEFFKDHPVSIHTLRDITTNTAFPSFAPYGKGVVSAFWNLNIYTNQRHLAAAYGFSLFTLLFLILPILRNKKPSLLPAIFFGALLGLSFFFHMAVFLMTIIVVGGVFLFFPKLRIPSLIVIFTAGFLALPQYFTVSQTGTASSLASHPGYLIGPQVTASNFFSYWFANLGLHMVFMIGGFIVAPKIAKNIFLAFLPIFLIGNLFQFSVEIAANHKFFNYFMLVGVMFSAYILVYLWEKRRLFQPFVIISIFFLTFSGTIDFFPVYNDSKGTLQDYPKNADVRWIMENTPKDSVFLNSSYLYHPASLAGRKIFLGWPYFPWSQGYDTLKRGLLAENLFRTNDIAPFCREANKYALTFIETIRPNAEREINHVFFEKNFPAVYKDQDKNTVIYDIAKGCLR